MDSVLKSIKKLLGIDADYDIFDLDVIIHANAAFSTLNQLGVGPERVFSIQSSAEEWGSFSDDGTLIEMVKPYIYMKVKLSFDPPQTSYAISALQDACKEYEWRLNVHREGVRHTHVEPSEPPQ